MPTCLYSLGLDQAGKTQTLYWLKYREKMTTTPTVGKTAHTTKQEGLRTKGVHTTKQEGLRTKGVHTTSDLSMPTLLLHNNYSY